MSEPQQIINQIASSFSQGLLAGKKILITAGPTREKIDPVRYISNRSSGKMGFSIAEAARECRRPCEYNKWACKPGNT